MGRLVKRSEGTQSRVYGPKTGYLTFAFTTSDEGEFEIFLCIGRKERENRDLPRTLVFVGESGSSLSNFNFSRLRSIHLGPRSSSHQNANGYECDSVLPPYLRTGRIRRQHKPRVVSSTLEPMSRETVEWSPFNSDEKTSPPESSDHFPTTDGWESRRVCVYTRMCLCWSSGPQKWKKRQSHKVSDVPTFFSFRVCHSLLGTLHHPIPQSVSLLTPDLPRPVQSSHPGEVSCSLPRDPTTGFGVRVQGQGETPNSKRRDPESKDVDILPCWELGRWRSTSTPSRDSGYMCVPLHSSISSDRLNVHPDPGTPYSDWLR